MLDAATTEVIRSYLLSAAQEMRRTLVRTAFNPVIYEVLDFGISLYDEQLELIADAPGLATTMQFAKGSNTSVAIISSAAISC
jgi:N-methylhydantoinase B